MLGHITGATAYEDLRTVNGHVYNTFHEAAKEFGILEDDTEYEKCLQEVNILKYIH